MFGMRSMWTTGLLAAASLMLTSSVSLGGPLGLRFGGVGVVPYGAVGYYYPGYYGYFAGPFAYGFYGPGYGVTVRYGLGLSGVRLGYGLGYGGLGYGAFGLGAPGAGFGVPLAPPANPLMQQRGQPGAMPPQQARPRQIPQPTPVPPEEQEDEAPVEDNAARVTVVVPEDAELWFNGTKTNQTGKRREFATAPLTPGKDFRYRIKARWIEDGKPVELTQTIKVRANSSQTVDFTKIQNAPVPE
jgi:uncharacterized protein (TIGR03000 family)